MKYKIFKIFFIIIKIEEIPFIIYCIYNKINTAVNGWLLRALQKTVRGS